MTTFIAPAGSPAPLEGDALDDAIQQTLAGIAGLDPTLARPRWQPNAPNLPDFNLDWAAFGITSTVPDTYAYLRQVDAATQELQRDEALIVLCSFYGPNAQSVCARFNDGLLIQPNRFALDAYGLKLSYTGEPRQVPALLKETWVKRFDLQVTLRRRVIRRYAVDAIGSLQSYLDNEFYLTIIKD